MRLQIRNFWTKTLTFELIELIELIGADRIDSYAIIIQGSSQLHMIAGIEKKTNDMLQM